MNIYGIITGPLSAYYSCASYKFKAHSVYKWMKDYIRLVIVYCYHSDSLSENLPSAGGPDRNQNSSFWNRNSVILEYFFKRWLVFEMLNPQLFWFEFLLFFEVSVGTRWRRVSYIWGNSNQKFCSNSLMIRYTLFHPWSDSMVILNWKI